MCSANCFELLEGELSANKYRYLQRRSISQATYPPGPVLTDESSGTYTALILRCLRCLDLQGVDLRGSAGERGCLQIPEQLVSIALFWSVRTWIMQMLAGLGAPGTAQPWPNLPPWRGSSRTGNALDRCLRGQHCAPPGELLCASAQ